MMSWNAQSLSPLSFSMPRGHVTPPRRAAAGFRFSWSELPRIGVERAPVADAAGLPVRAAAEHRFGCFRLIPKARALLREGRPVECGSRAFDLLHVLLMSRGELVSKEAIVRHVWPTTVVEESNLRFQMASLRKVLGEYRDLIKTVPGRGYLFASDSES